MDPNSFFGHHIDPLSLGGQTVALMLTLVLSGFVGFERQCRGQPAGLRTHILVGVGSTLITITSIAFGSGGTAGRGDAARLAAQIVSGIGFLGAGAILRDGSSVHGLTTAASIWAVAAIGIAVGGSPRLGELATIATFIVLGTLIVLNRLEDALHLKNRIRLLEVEIKEADHASSRLLGLLLDQRIRVLGVTFSDGKTAGAEPTRIMKIRTMLPFGFNPSRLLKLLAAESAIVRFEIE